MASTYIVPFVVYLLGTIFASRYEGEQYAISYSIVAAVVAIVIGALLAKDRVFKMHWKVHWAVIAGLVGIVLWILLCQLKLEQYLASFLPKFLQPESRVAFKPFDELSNQWALVSFLTARLVGIAILVPIAEELFWRGFLLRWLIDPEYEKVSLGEFTPSSCAIVTLMFTLAHPEWLAAAVYCLLLNGFLYWKKDLWLCIVAHGTSNLALAVYVMATGAWELW